MASKWNVGLETARGDINRTTQRGMRISMEPISRRFKFVKVYHIASRMESGQSLIDFTGDVGVPETLLTDVAGEFTGQNTEFVKHSRRIHMQLQN